MELYALKSGSSSFNPFTSLIGLDSVGDTRGLALAAPVIEEPRHSRYSVLFHELAHLWSMRATRLGGILSAAAAPALVRWRKHPTERVAIPERAFLLLGAWLPILEGLATYAELDFEGDEDIDPIHSPILKVLGYTEASIRGISNEQQLKFIRLFRNTEEHLLAATLLERPTSPNEHAYLSGYLYVKALASRLMDLCPRLKPSSRMLPLLIRVLCDHPAVLDWRDTSVNPQRLLARVHNSALAITPALLSQIADWIETADPAEVVTRFDYLNIEESLRQSSLRFHEPSSEWYDGVPADAYEDLSRLRHAASFYIVAWRSGKLLSVSEKSFVLQQGSELAEYTLLSAANFCADTRPILEMLVAELQGAIGAELTAAFYIDVSSGDSGMAFWKDEKFLFASPYSLSVLRKAKEDQEIFARNLGCGLALSPVSRRRFAEAIDTPRTFTSTVTDASLFLLAQMISSERLQNRILRSKLANIENGRFLPEWHAWCLPPTPFYNTPLPARLIQAYDRIFDFPGFNGTKPQSFANLLPRFEVQP